MLQQFSLSTGISLVMLILELFLQPYYFQVGKMVKYIYFKCKHLETVRVTVT